jgi:hypothetical protein
MNTMKPHHIRRSLADTLACWLLRAAAAEWWPVLAPMVARHCSARGATCDGVEARQGPCRAGVWGRLMRQRRAGVTRPLRVAPRSARDRM